MLTAAIRLKEELLEGGPVEMALREHPGYALVLTGHSLGAGLTSLLAAILGPRLLLAGEASWRAVEAFAYAPPAILSHNLAIRATHVTSVVDGPDVVPRFGLATSENLRDSLGAVHQEAGLLERAAARQSAAVTSAAAASAASTESDATQTAAPSVTAAKEDAAWARSVLDWIDRDVTASRPRLFPPGKVLWRRDGGSGLHGQEFAFVDPSEFGNILLAGSQMFTSHVPNAYARAVLGEIPLVPFDRRLSGGHTP